MTSPSRAARELQRERALRYLYDIKRIRRTTSAPLAFRLLWRFGVDLAPPHFNSFLVNAAVAGSHFGVFWWLIMWPMQWLRDGTPLATTLLAALVAAAFFGLGMAAYYRYDTRKHGVPPMGQLPTAE
ncbi:hypothetical protein CSQ96_03775 [Janthinobacterium sp. BJB412]|nr:hypothetical protein CSQ96_03775 [Janthinobacterium sp. BJB412]